MNTANEIVFLHFGVKKNEQFAVLIFIFLESALHSVLFDIQTPWVIPTAVTDYWNYALEIFLNRC